MSKSTMRSRGQLTVPKDVREQLGLQNGDRVVFELEGDSVRLRIERRKSLKELWGSLPANRRHPGKEGEREAAREHVVGRMLDESSD